MGVEKGACGPRPPWILKFDISLFIIVKGHKDGGKLISHILLTGKLVSRFPTHHQSCKCKTNLTGEMLALENK